MEAKAGVAGIPGAEAAEATPPTIYNLFTSTELAADNAHVHNAACTGKWLSVHISMWCNVIMTPPPPTQTHPQ